MGREGSLAQTWTSDTISFLVVTVTVPDCCTFQQHKPRSTYSAVDCVLLRGQAVNIHRTATQENSSGTFLEILAPLLSRPAFSLLEGYNASPSSPASILSAYGQPLGCISVSFFSHQIESSQNFNLRLKEEHGSNKSYVRGVQPGLLGQYRHFAFDRGYFLLISMCFMKIQFIYGTWLFLLCLISRYTSYHEDTSYKNSSLS